MRRKKTEKTNKIRRYSIIIAIVTIAILSFETIGYAAISSLLTLNGNVTWQKDGKLLITDVTQVSLTRATQNATPSVDGRHVQFNVSLSPTRQGSATAVYDVTMTNNSSFVHTYTNADIQRNFTNTNRVNTNVSVTGLTQGQRIEPGDTVTFRVTITGTRSSGQNQTATGTADVTINTNALSNGNLMATLDNNTGNLVGHDVTHFSVSAMNTRPYAQTLTITTGTEKIQVVDASGNPLGNLNIDASETKNLDFYLKIADGVMFASSPYTANVTLRSSDGTIISLGSVSLTVPINGEIPHDETAPIVSNVTASKNSTDGSVTVSYSGTDDSEIATYYIKACKEVSTDNYDCGDPKTSGTTSYTFEGLSYGTYKFVVYAEDEYGNVATTNEINSATTSSGHASASTPAFYRWKVTVTFNLTNMYYNGSNTQGTVDIDYNQDYTFTLRGISNNYTLPNTITIANSNGNLTQGTGYTYAQNSGNVTIYAAYTTENLNVSGQATYNGGICLVEGTKIKLANGKEKNIENITYTDLLKAWSYETGKVTYEYPIWIEKSSESDSYQKTTFSDGTVLKTVGLHQVFSLDENKFVNIYEDGKFIKVGTKVAKVVNDKIVPVTITKVETVYEKVKYYYVASSIYYNIISEDIITTSDQIVPGVTLSNMYGFDKNIKWPAIRKEIISKPGALYEYKDLEVMPYYLYYGSRGNETKIFVNMGYATTPELIAYLQRTQLNPDKALPPITDKEGNLLWMVTTSDDVVLNESKYLYKEGSIYKLGMPKPVRNKKFVGWYNTVDEKYYKPGDKYKVIHGTHFIAVWK